MDDIHSIFTNFGTPRNEYRLFIYDQHRVIGITPGKDDQPYELLADNGATYKVYVTDVITIDGVANFPTINGATISVHAYKKAKVAKTWVERRRPPWLLRPDSLKTKPRDWRRDLAVAEALLSGEPLDAVANKFYLAESTTKNVFDKVVRFIGFYDEEGHRGLTLDDMLPHAAYWRAIIAKGGDAIQADRSKRFSSSYVRPELLRPSYHPEIIQKQRDSKNA